MTSGDLLAKALRGEVVVGAIVNRSYSTVRWGYVSAFAGEAIVRGDDGHLYRVVGHGPTGTAELLRTPGGATATRIESDSEVAG